jgi:hypothetical protein
MTQGAVAQGHTMSTNVAFLTAEQQHEVAEYRKIVRFAEDVFAGKHPYGKPPPHLQTNEQAISSHSSSITPRVNGTAYLTPNSSLQQESPQYINNASPNNQSTAPNSSIPVAAKLARSEINPILLEKSDDLIKAEIQLQRQRLERALREQIEQQKLAAKASIQSSESLPSFDLSEVLSKALAIVHPETIAEPGPSAEDQSPASDSFDENSFYSSQHDTPEPYSPQESKGLAQVEQRDAYDEDTADYSPKPHVEKRDTIPRIASNFQDNIPAVEDLPDTQPSPFEYQPQYPSLRGQQDSNGESSQFNSSENLVGNSSSKSTEREKEKTTVSKIQNNRPWPTTVGHQLDNCEKYDIDREFVQNTVNGLLAQAYEDNRASLLIRAHDLSPFAPQPARVSPLATARNPPVPQENFPTDEAPPAQVAALRGQISGISSTDSSPKGAKGSEKKKGKKKKRKASSNENTNAPDSPYIKPEPRSPSPFASAPLPRPQKRQRQTEHYAAGLNYDESRYERPEGAREHVTERVVERYQEPRAYQRYEDRYEIEARRREPVYQRIEQEDTEYRRVSDGHYSRQPQSPGLYAAPYAPGEVRQVRAASHTVVDHRVRDEPVYYREPPRASMRPEADRERSRSPIRERRSPIMGPPRQPVRIVVDAYGREYIDPHPAPPIRQSVAPPSRYRDSEMIYERAPPRTVSSRAHIEYEEDGVYRRPASPVAVSRRVITQPEYAVSNYRPYRQREYSVRPMAPPGDDYLQRVAPDRRQMSHFEEPPREMTARPTSVRPGEVRYELPREYVGRLQSVRPEPVVREMAPPSQREISVRPIDPNPPRREHVLAGRENEVYYDDVPNRRPAEVAFIERPHAREQSVLVYPDGMRRGVRDVYR